MRNRFVDRLSLTLIFLVPAHLAQAQEAIDSSGLAIPTAQGSKSENPRPSVDVADQVLACARQEAFSVGFQAQLSVLGSVLHRWRPHFQSIDTEEMDYVRVRIYGRGSQKGLRWEVEAHTLTGRAFIATSVYSPRPPSREASALRRRIQQECKPGGAGT
jgi:hypothetical protein